MQKTFAGFSNHTSKSWTKTGKPTFTFIDLFAGIGGFRIAAESHGGKCVFSSEWDKHSQHTYQANFNDLPQGDITKISEEIIPDHDILFAGFPCQAFSISGKRKGFDDTRGTLFFDVARIIKARQPKMFLLENVKNFARHDNGNTLKVVLKTLSNLGYTVYHQVLRASDYGVPQARERIYIIGFKRKRDFEYPKPLGDDKTKIVADILETSIEIDAKIIDREITMSKDQTVIDKRRPKQIGKFNKGGQGERVYSVYAAGITLSAYGGGAASKTGAYKVGDIIRKLSPRECARLQGFPDDFHIPVTASYALKQFGDSVSVPVIKLLIANMLKADKNGN
jgi:DNA (cytosine-5)-methyltransferase 1